MVETVGVWAPVTGVMFDGVAGFDAVGAQSGDPFICGVAGL